MTVPPSPPVFDPEFRARLAELLSWRRDVRRFRRDKLPANRVERLVALAALAPSVGLSQPWRFVAIDSPARREAVRADFAHCNAAALAAQAPERAQLYARLKLAGLDDAPCQLAVFVDPATGQGSGLGRATMPETIAYSAVIAVHTLWLAARAEGIGMGWVSILDPARIAAIAEVPQTWRLVAYLCLGYPAEPDDIPELERAGWERRQPVSQSLIRR
jgi:5,6-dimethylbenzimidazole synthase